LEVKGNYYSVGVALNLYVVESASQQASPGGWQIGLRDLYIETIAATISFVVTERNIGSKSYA